jgi:glycosyltransferase involved in cell wall biosynthesis
VSGRTGSYAVVILTETFHPETGGGETQARTLAEGLRAAGRSVHLITRRSDAAQPASEHVGGVPVHRVAPAGRGQLRKWGLVVTALIELVRLRRECDVLLVCGYRILGIPALLFALLTGRPCVLKADSQGELSGAFFDPGLARLGLRHDRIPVRPLVWLRNRLLCRADRFVAISEVIETEYLRAGIAPERIVRIPNSADVERFRPVDAAARRRLRERLGLPPERPIAIFTGRLVTTKGLRTLLAAWRSVVADRPDALLLVVGSGGLGLQNCEDELRAFVATHDLGAHVHFTGAVERVHEYLQASDLFVFPTEREAFGISVVEAMACGLPIVTTTVDGVRDVVRPGVDALVVPPGDPAALARALRRVQAGNAALPDLGAAARERAVGDFSTGRVVAAYDALLVDRVRT